MVEEIFQEALNLLTSEFERSLSIDDQLQLYGLYKVATVGDPPATTPSFLNQRAYRKHQAWVKYSDLSASDAKVRYVAFCRETADANDDANLADTLQELLRRAATLTDDATKAQPVSSTTTIQPVTSMKQTGKNQPSGLVSKSLGRLGVKPLIPRGNLDISNSDLLFGIQQCLFASKQSTKRLEAKIQDHCEQNALVGLSVRSLLDLYLRVQQFPADSEIIVSPPINVPGMLTVLKHHRIKVVGVDLPQANTVAVDVDQIKAAITDQTVAILVVHVFGMMAASESDMQDIRQLADGNSLDVLEDCAECYTGAYSGSPHADLSFFSFGTIKTASSLQGAIVQGSHKVIDDMRQLQDSVYVQQTNAKYLWRVIKCIGLCFMADSDWTMGFVYMAISLCFDFDKVITWLVRGYGKKQMQQIRHKPSPALLALLLRRLQQSKAVHRAIEKKVEVCDEVKEKLAGSYTFPETRGGLRNNYWLFPVLSKEPELVSQRLRKKGLDATRGATQLCTVSDTCTRATEMMDRVFYLPIGGLRERGTTKYRNTDLLVGPVESLETALPHQQLTSDSSSCMKTFGPMLLLSLLFCFAVLIPRLYIRQVVWHGLILAIALFILTLAAILALRWLCAHFYISSSTAFAKYSPLIEKQLAADTNAEPETANVLSSLKVLDLPSSTGEQRAVFLTGATGFVGSMILRDLLLHRKTLHVERVVLLCRSKKGKTARERIDDLFKSDMFSFLSVPEKESVVEVVEGCVETKDAGVSVADILKTKAKSTITHVVHCAANVNFTMLLGEAASANISSALHMQSLASKLNKNARFVYISTAFVHGARSGSKNQPLSEDLFSFGRFDTEEVYKSMLGTQFYASKAMRELGFPNAYTFSKSVCENLLVKNDPDVMIIRPSIVGPAVSSPFEGWAGTAPSTLVAAACLFMTYQFNLWSLGRHRVPVVPVDVVSRFTIRKMFDDFVSRDQETSSDDTSFGNDFETISKTSSKFSSPRSSPANTVVNRKYHIFTAAWNVESGEAASFNWLDFAAAIAHVGCVVGHFGRLTASVALSCQCRLMPWANMSLHTFTLFHKWLVLRPFAALIRVMQLLGADTKMLERLEKFLDLPMLFFPFTTSEFCFESELMAPPVLSGERYLFSCVIAAHAFIKKIQERQLSGSSKPSRLDDRLTSLPLSSSSQGNGPPSLLWALSQPRGNILVRIVGWLLGNILFRCYDKVTVDVTSFSTLRDELETLDSGVVVLAPTHRSVFDFLFISYVCFAIPELQVKMPRIAAAIEFKKLPFVGFLVQYLGAFFVQRGRMEADPTLGETIKTISSSAQHADLSLEVFIEGKRSRDRRFVKPKTGILRHVLASVGSYVVSPIAISYERIAEQEIMVKEACGNGSTSLSFSGMMVWVSVRTLCRYGAFLTVT